MNDQQVLDAVFRPGVRPLKTPGLKAIVRRSCGIQDQPAEPAKGEVVWRGRGGSTITYRPQFSERLAAINRRLDQTIARLDEAQPRQAPPAQPTQQVAVKASTYGGDYTTRLPLPETGQQSGYPQYAVIQRHGASSPRGLAAAVYCQQKDGPDPKLVLQQRRRGLTPRQAARLSVGLPIG